MSIVSLLLPCWMCLCQRGRSWTGPRPPLREAVTLISGDFNLLALGEGRYNVATGELVTEAVAEQALLAEALASCVEIRAAGYSRRQFRGGRLHLLSRLDRAFISGDAGPYLGEECTARYLSSAMSTTLPSDHAPLEVCAAPSAGSRRWRRPLWAATHPIFIERMAEAIPLMSEAADSSFQALRDTVHTMKGVVREIRLSSVPPGSSVFAWHAHWLAAARQAWARYDDEEV